MSEERIDRIEYLLNEISKKLDALMMKSLNGENENDDMVKSPTMTNNVKIPAYLKHIVKFFKEMYTKERQILIDKGIINVEMEEEVKNQNAVNLNKKKRDNSKPLEYELGIAHYLYKIVGKDEIKKSLLIDLKEEKNIEYSKTQSTPISLEPPSGMS